MAIMNKMLFKKLDETGTLDKLKSLLGITTNDKDVLLQFALDDTKMLILNYCNLTFIPKGLETVWLKMAIEFYGASGSNSGSVSVGSTVGGQITEIKEGETTVKFSTESTTSTTTTSSGSTTDGIINNYIAQLNCYRKV